MKNINFIIVIIIFLVFLLLIMWFHSTKSAACKHLHGEYKNIEFFIRLNIEDLTTKNSANYPCRNNYLCFYLDVVKNSKMLSELEGGEEIIRVFNRNKVKAIHYNSQGEFLADIGSSENYWGTNRHYIGYLPMTPSDSLKFLKKECTIEKDWFLFSRFDSIAD